MVVGQLLHIRLCGVLAQGTEDVPDLADLNPTITLLVKKLESLLKICQWK